MRGDESGRLREPRRVPEQCLYLAPHWRWDPAACQCLPRADGRGPHSPIIVDTHGNGFSLTSAEDGVHFDMDGDGTPERLAWTTATADDAWLALDRNANGSIDNGRELFGNYTAQSPTSEPHGFLALAEYDKAQRGGNNDGVIDNRDAVFARLRLWQDANHNRISEANELHTLPSMNVNGMELRYVDRSYRDRHGNNFRYHSVVYANRTDPRTWRWASDVFLVAAP